MAYTIKYIGECITKNTNIYPIYEKDLNYGVKVFLVCEKEYEALIDIKDIDKYYSVVEAKNSKSNLSVLFSDNPKIDCVYLAVQFNQVECEFYTEYDGVYSINPKKYNYAKKIDKLDYDEVLIISDFGYEFISGQVLEVAKRYGIAIRVISYNTKDTADFKGSIIKEALASDKNVIKAIIKDPSYCIVTVFSICDEIGTSYKLFKLISEKEIIINSIVLPASNKGKQDISFTIAQKDKKAVVEILKNKENDVGVCEFCVDDDVAKISLIGAGIKSNFGVSAEVFKVLYDNNINLKMINSTEIKISMFIEKEKSDLALEKLHKHFI